MTDLTNAPPLPDLEDTRRNAEFWFDAGQSEPDRDKAVRHIAQAMFAWKNAACGVSTQLTTLRAQLSAETARADARERDAKRYRWMRENLDNKDASVVFKIGDDRFDYAVAKNSHTFDQAIDAAIGAPR